MAEATVPPKAVKDAEEGQDGLSEKLRKGTNALHLRVGIMINGFESSYYGHMADGAVDYLKCQGIETILNTHSRSKEGELEAWQSLLDCECDGLIAHVDSLTDEDLRPLMEMHEKGVLMNRPMPGFDDRCVWFDNFHGGVLAAEHLIAKGHKKFAMVTGPERFFEVKARTTGFLSALKEAGVELPAEHQIESNFLEEGGGQAMQALMQSKKAFSAVFFHNDEMAMGALAACADKGLRVPEDISIIGFDDMPLSILAMPPLTTIRQPLREIGEETARLMVQLLCKDSAREEIKPVQSVFGPILVERESVSSYDHQQSEQRLTPREIECLLWASRGKTAWEISKILGISERTVVFHFTNVAEKLNATNRQHAISKALLYGIVKPSV